MSVAPNIEAANLQLSICDACSLQSCPWADPARALGLEEGDAHVIRNAGGRAVDAIRSLIISQHLLGTREIIILHHTDCGMLAFTDSALHDKIYSDTGLSINDMSFYPFRDVRESVLEDIEFLKAHPLLIEKLITGYIYDVKTGKIEKVEQEMSKIGQEVDQ
ncbi:MAG: hypothetical protein M1834_004856 [Cirrosporium novae-zelandiae]|nr:MAG: hypothetical protein M1834_004856 [Cirrosporium novae-zelandiae]